MNAHDLDTERFEAIEAFLLDTMSAETRTSFITMMERDDDLREEVEVQRDNMMSVDLAGFTRRVQKIAAGVNTSSKVAGRAPWLKYAAMMALLLTGALWWSTRHDRNERLYAEYHVVDPGLPVPMSISKDPIFHDAMVAYKLGEYEEARIKWAPLLQLHPGNDTLRYYMATALLEMDSTDQAISLLEGVARDSSSQFSRKSQWYLLLTYLRTGRTDLFGTIHLDDDPTYGARVQAIKDELKK